ncbi:MAG: DinB family protein [Caldilineaceae bacterium]
MSPAERHLLIDKIRCLPVQIELLVSGLDTAQLTTHFLAQEWSVAQNVHHLADSHMNSYIRCKLILTEEHPTLKPYDQDAWAALPDAQNPAVTGSLALLKELHRRWVTFWETLPDDAWQRTGFHPENGTVTLDDQLRSYAAHGEAHINQIARTLAAQ